MSDLTDAEWEQQLRTGYHVPSRYEISLLRLLDAERAKVARVEAFAARLVADGHSTCIYESAAEMGQIIRDALVHRPAPRETEGA